MSSRNISPQQRLRLVAAGLEQGKSLRHIGKELGFDEATIRRDRQKLKLPQPELDAIRAGAAAEPILRAHKQRRAVMLCQQRSLEERRNRAHSSDLGQIAIYWLESKEFHTKDGKSFRLLPADILHIVYHVDSISWVAAASQATAVPYPEGPRVITACKPQSPQPLEVFEIIEWMIPWFARWIVRLEPNRDIRDRALTKVRQHFEIGYRGW
jgi:transposase-like protein